MGEVVGWVVVWVCEMGGCVAEMGGWVAEMGGWVLWVGGVGATVLRRLTKTH